MKKYRWIIILVNLLLILVLFNRNMVKKEKLLTDGQLILLELAPVDPRSLMQGDYMQLRYKIARRNFRNDSLAKRGYCVVRLKTNGVAEKVRFQPEYSSVDDKQYLIKYTAAKSWFGWEVSIGAESFFFQEGEGDKYEKAKYGGIKVDKKGNSLLVGLYDQNLKQIK